MYLARRGIPVMAHIGLMPQAMNTAGGFRAVRDEALWEDRKRSCRERV